VNTLNNIRKLTIAAFLMVTFIGTMASNAAAMDGGMGNPNNRPVPGMPDHTRMQDGSVWINTDILTVMASPEQPDFHFWFTTDDNGTNARFSSNYVNLIEFEDQNNDSAFQMDEILYSAPLSAYEWTITTGEVVVDGVTQEVWLKYTKSGVKSSMMMDDPHDGFGDMGAVERFADVTIQIWAHIYLNDYTGEVTDDHGVHFNYTVAGKSELKTDIEIANFPFSSENSSVALRVMLNENQATGMQNMHQHRIETRERFRNTTLESDSNWTTTGGNETRFEQRNSTLCQRMDFVDSTTDVAQGYFTWLDKAVITWPGGETEAVNVTASYVPSGDGTAVYLAYPYFDDGSILHDPSIGLYPEAAPSIGIPINYVVVAGIGVVALLAILVVLVRKK
jgi:hypothetical protein